MTFTPNHHQVVEIADGLRPIASNLRNVVDACKSTAEWFSTQTDDVKEEAAKICTIARFLEIKAIVKGIQEEVDAGLLAYEGPKGLPVREVE